jgi:hypothetical protein
MAGAEIIDSDALPLFGIEVPEECHVYYQSAE